MSSHPFIIFLPVRNGGDYIDQALGSIVAQDDENWRLIVLENTSSDDTLVKVHGYDDPRINVVEAERPLSISENWHRAYEWLEMNGVTDALVTTIGHDDILNPGFLSGMRGLVAEYPDATLFQSAFDLIDSSGQLIRPCKPIPSSETWQGLAAALCWGIRDSYGTGYVFRARDYRRVGGIPDLPLLLYADHLLFIRLAALGHKQATDAVLCRYRLHAGSASNSLSGATLNGYVEALDRFVTTLNDEMPDFVQSPRGRDALSCLIACQIVSLGRNAVRPLLTPVNRERMARFATMYAALSPWAPPEAFISASGSRSVRRLERFIDAWVLTRVWWRERRTATGSGKSMLRL